MADAIEPTGIQMSAPTCAGVKAVAATVAATVSAAAAEAAAVASATAAAAARAAAALICSEPWWEQPEEKRKRPTKRYTSKQINYASMQDKLVYLWIAL